MEKIKLSKLDSGNPIKKLYYAVTDNEKIEFENLIFEKSGTFSNGKYLNITELVTIAEKQIENGKLTTSKLQEVKQGFYNSGVKQGNLEHKANPELLQSYLNEYSTLKNQNDLTEKRLKDSIQYSSELTEELETTKKENEGVLTELKSKHSLQLEKLKENQNLELVLKNALNTTNEFYNGSFAKDSNSAYKRAKSPFKNHMQSSKYQHIFGYHTSTYLVFSDLNVEIDSTGVRIEDEPEDVKKGSKNNYFGISLDVLANSKEITEEELKQLNLNQIEFNLLKGKDMYLQYESNNESGHKETIVYGFSVKGEEENIFTEMVRNDLPKVFNSVAIGAFELAINEKKYVEATKIASKYINQDNKAIFSGIISDTIEKNPVASGYLAGIKLPKENQDSN